MHIFIDESGRAVASAKKSVACVAALVVPSSQIEALNEWFLAIEKKYGKLIKGSELNDPKLRDKILKELVHFDVFVECTAIDMELHTNDIISQSKEERARSFTDLHETKNPFLQQMRALFADNLRKTSNQLYLQAGLSWRLIELVLRHGTIYFSQNRPEELGVFHWIVDPKEAGKVTNYEKLWTDLVLPYLQCQPSLTCIDGHDYSYLERYSIKDIDLYHTDSGERLRKEDLPLDLNKIIKENLSFPDDKNTPGLRIVDVIANTIYRAMNGKLDLDGYQSLGSLFFIRKPANCISLMTLCDISREQMMNRNYRKVLHCLESRNKTIWL